MRMTEKQVKNGPKKTQCYLSALERSQWRHAYDHFSFEQPIVTYDIIDMGSSFLNRSSHVPENILVHCLLSRAEKSMGTTKIRLNTWFHCLPFQKGELGANLFAWNILKLNTWLKMKIKHEY